jgi:Na+-transporting NADH:ubiquinone oxidoreductase subunit A
MLAFKFTTLILLTREVVWYINPQDVVIHGKLFDEGIFDAYKLTVTGSQVNNLYYKTIVGSSIKKYSY